MKEIHCIIVKTSRNIEDWVCFLNENRFKYLIKKPKAIELDMLNVRFIEPYHVVSLACLIEEYHLKGVKIHFKNTDSKGAMYLKKLKFFQYWIKGFDRTKHRQTDVGTAFCLWKLHPEMINSYSTLSKNYYQNQFFSERNLQPLNTTLVEIFNNIIDHSKSKVSGYVFTQYYPNKNLITLSVCDFGQGIPQTINKFLKEHNKNELTHGQALIKSFEKGFSTKSTPHNRGFGLDNVFSVVKALKSSLQIISNSGFVEQEGSILRKIVIKNNFPGTQIVIMLKTKELKPLEIEEISENEFYL